MPALFAITLFFSSLLLFLIQPMIAKMILPVLGGTPAVWNTCIVFFQTMLLAGYLYAHLLSKWAARRHALPHLAFLLIPLLTLPLMTLPVFLAAEGSLPRAPQPVVWLLEQTWILHFLQQRPDPAHPIPWLLALLMVSIGVPFFLVSTTAPLLQHWFASTANSSSKDPYYLYAASNLGSLLALLAYPALLEPNLPLGTQTEVWTIGYVVLIILIGICAMVSLRSPSSFEDEQTTKPLESPPTLGRRIRWLVLAAIPSSLLLGVTTYLSTDVAAVPLLWVIPLSLYLLSFVLVFARNSLISRAWITGALPLLLLMQIFVFGIDLKRSIWILFLLHLATFFMVALFCHGELARDRPQARYLTEFYLCLSGGGVLGGLFNALIAPLLFNRWLEYPLALVLTCLLLPRTSSSLTSARRTGRNVPKGNTWITLGDLWFPLSLGLLMLALIFGLHALGVKALWLKATLLFGLPAAICYTFVNRPLRFALGLAALLLTGGLGRDLLSSRAIFRDRSFFGVLSVVERSDQADPPTMYRHFVHGHTDHGQQCLDPQRRREPLTYFTKSSPIGQLFQAFARSPKRRYAVLGLGAGTLASYAEKGQQWTFYEIDPAVKRIAEQYFTFLQDGRDRGALVEIIPGDARLSLRDAPDGSFDMIFADAFSSDAVPVHLLTREALQLYLNKLADDGLIVFNITNRYVDLEPVLGSLAEDAGLHCLTQKEEKSQISDEEYEKGKRPSQWVLMARRPEYFGKHDVRWNVVKPGPAVWTDDYSNLLSAFRWN